MSARTPRFWAVIPAAGGGARMGAGKPKQYLDLWDRTLLGWSIRPFLEAGGIDGVVLVLARADVEFARLGLSGMPARRHTQRSGFSKSAPRFFASWNCVSSPMKGIDPHQSTKASALPTATALFISSKSCSRSRHARSMAAALAR